VWWGTYNRHEEFGGQHRYTRMSAMHISTAITLLILKTAILVVSVVDYRDPEWWLSIKKFCLTIKCNHQVWGVNPGRGQEIYLCSKTSRLILRPTHLPIQWMMGALSAGKEWFGNEADHSIVTPKAKFKKSTDFVDTMMSKVLCDLCFSLNQLPK
jgi:hypothetical protein